MRRRCRPRPSRTASPSAPAGHKVLALSGATPRESTPRQTLCADIGGLSLYAAVRCEANQRKRLELLCATSPARLHWTSGCSATLLELVELKTLWRAGCRFQKLVQSAAHVRTTAGRGGQLQWLGLCSAKMLSGWRGTSLQRVQTRGAYRPAPISLARAERHPNDVGQDPRSSNRRRLENRQLRAAPVRP